MKTIFRMSLVLDSIGGVLFHLPSGVLFELYLRDARAGQVVLRDFFFIHYYYALAIILFIISMYISNRQSLIRKQSIWVVSVAVAVAVINVVLSFVFGILFGWGHCWIVSVISST